MTLVAWIMLIDRRCAALCAVMGLCVLAAPAAAQDAAAAKTLFAQGLSDMEAGNFEKGCPALDASYKLDPRAGTLFTLAECENKRGRLATAAARYDDYLSLYSRLPADQQRKQADREKTAREQKAALGLQAPLLTLSLAPDAPRETVVKRDGTELAAAALGLGLPVDPGEHRVTTQAPGGEVTELQVILGKGDKKQITLQVKAAQGAPPPAPPKPAQGAPPAPPRPAVIQPAVVSSPASQPSPAAGASRGPSGRRVGAYVVGGVGVAGLVLGGVMGGLTLGKKSVLEKNCGIRGDATGCNDQGLSAASDAKTFGLVSTVGFAVGGAGVATAVILLLTAPKRATEAPRGVQPGVLSAGREGAIVGFRGAW